ncbi:MAG: hypothetical protein LBN18_08550 [Dysgonamonadaceae bacterium]|jgi:hypothetical protein|nr:hypothetical protein [Dysgonamonadaceae bacterium]
MNTYYNHFAYGEDLARRLRAISHTDTDQHFYRATEAEELQDLIAHLSSVHGMILVAIDGHNSDFKWANSDSLMERSQYFFLVLQQTVSGDTDTVFAAQQECTGVARQIIARIMNDAHDPKVKPLHFIDAGSFTLRGVGPVGDNFYGSILGFNRVVGMNYQINTAMWHE